MPVKIISNTYTDIYGNVSNSYRANAGDKIKLTSIVEADISITEEESLQINADFINSQFLILGNKSWLQEGFRLGDTVDIEFFVTDTGASAGTLSYVIDYLSDTVLRTSVAFSFSLASDDYTKKFSVARNYTDLELNINHVDQESNPAFNSPIDGELTKIKFAGISGLSVSGTVTGSIIGNQSGGYLISSVVTRNADSHSVRKYTIETYFIQLGVLNDELFELGTCLKLAVNYKFYSLSNETANVQTLEFSETADTGYFDEAYNVGVINSTLTTGISELDYEDPTTTSIVIESSATNFYIGSQYFSINEDYYKNKLSSQQALGYLLNGYSALAVGTYTSVGGLYEITVNSITTVGTTNTFNITFTPLAGFSDFMESRGEDDRTFYIWVNVGTVNHLVFSSQMTKTIDTELPLSTDVFTFIRHNQNIETSTLIYFQKDKINTEDNIALYSRFKLLKDTIWDGLRITIFARNGTSLDQFTLETMFFDFSALQINSDGQYLIDVTQNVSNNLPSTSSKKKAHIWNDLSNDRLHVHYPFISRWEYWLTFLTANSDFYPNQNRNWEVYESLGTVLDWRLYAEISLENDIAYKKEGRFAVYDYNTEPIINTVIELYREDNTLTTALFSGEIMTVKAIHTYSGYTAVSSWGEITVEPFESQPRWLLSTVVEHDNNLDNPLSPITGNYVTSVSSLSQTVLTCKLDVDKLTDTNFKFTSKIFLEIVEAIGFEFQNEVAVQPQTGTFLDTQNT